MTQISAGIIFIILLSLFMLTGVKAEENIKTASVSKAAVVK